MADSPINSPRNFVFHDDSQYFTTTIGYDDWFKTTDANNCPYTSCNMLNSECNSAYSGGSNLQYTTASLIKIEAMRNVKEGYSITVCIKCYSGSESIQRQQIFTQAPLDCATVISKTSFTPQTLTYSAGITAEPISNDWTSFFVNSKATYCEV